MADIPAGDNLIFNADSEPYYVPPAGDCLLFAEGYAVCGGHLVFSASSAAYTPPNGDAVNFVVGTAPVEATDPIDAHATVSITAAGELGYAWAGDARVSITATGDLTLNIELAGAATVSVQAAGALTVGYEISGTTAENEIPVGRELRAYAADTGELLASTTSDPITGAYLLDLHDYKQEIYVLCLGSETYGPLAHGPVTPDWR